MNIDRLEGILTGIKIQKENSRSYGKVDISTVSLFSLLNVEETILNPLSKKNNLNLNYSRITENTNPTSVSGYFLSEFSLEERNYLSERIINEHVSEVWDRLLENLPNEPSQTLIEADKKNIPFLVNPYTSEKDRSINEEFHVFNKNGLYLLKSIDIDGLSKYLTQYNASLITADSYSEIPYTILARFIEVEKVNYFSKMKDFIYKVLRIAAEKYKDNSQVFLLEEIFARICFSGRILGEPLNYNLLRPFLQVVCKEYEIDNFDFTTLFFNKLKYFTDIKLKDLINKPMKKTKITDFHLYKSIYVILEFTQAVMEIYKNKKYEKSLQEMLNVYFLNHIPMDKRITLDGVFRYYNQYDIQNNYLWGKFSIFNENTLKMFSLAIINSWNKSSKLNMIKPFITEIIGRHIRENTIIGSFFKEVFFKNSSSLKKSLKIVLFQTINSNAD